MSIVIFQTGSKYTNPDKDSRGLWMSRSILGLASKVDRPNLHYAIYDPKDSRPFDPPPETGWRYEPPTMEKKIREGRILFPKSADGRPREKVFLKELQTKFPGLPSIISDIYTADGTEEIRAILGAGAFPFPKPSRLISRLIEQATDSASIILDSFAGSGTTAHAVLALNKKDGGSRKFILVQCDELSKQTGEMEDVCYKLTAERVRRVIKGYEFEGKQCTELFRASLSWTKLRKASELVEEAESIETFEGSRFDKVTKTVEDGALVVIGEKKINEKMDGLGGSFTFATLGPEMTLDKLLSDGLPAFEALAKYVFFTATGRTLTDVPKQKKDLFGFISETDVYRVHLHYQPDKAWLKSNDAALTETLLDAMLATNTGKKKLLVFAAAKFMSQRELSRQRVEFCQLPYAIHRILGD